MTHPTWAQVAFLAAGILHVLLFTLTFKTVVDARVWMSLAAGCVNLFLVIMMREKHDWAVVIVPTIFAAVASFATKEEMIRGVHFFVYLGSMLSVWMEKETRIHPHQQEGCLGDPEEGGVSKPQ